MKLCFETIQGSGCEFSYHFWHDGINVILYYFDNKSLLKTLSLPSQRFVSWPVVTKLLNKTAIVNVLYNYSLSLALTFLIVINYALESGY